jgi:hypothetical protein
MAALKLCFQPEETVAEIYPPPGTPGVQSPEPQGRGSGKRSRSQGDLFQACRKTKGGSKGAAGMKTANSMLPALRPLKREGNIIYFPGAWEEEAPESPKAPEQQKLPFSEHCEGFKNVTFGNFKYRILFALYHCRIHSLEGLAKIPPGGLLKIRRIGRKSLELIQAALESRGFTLQAGG